ncbi:hypothetical protein [Flavobacterium sp.]|uniref:hypothetical protein n=1 Tax=Flavobacterium sp. TaxID=239 RepID=UPI00261AE516|nr:hypothetical protein [Flavobacterium sp.]
MELYKIDILIEKYFQGETSIAEEKELRSYFSSQNVAPHLEQYKAMFGYFTEAKQQEFTQEIPQQTKKQKVMWLSIAASVVVFFGMIAFFMVNTDQPVNQKELGSYDSPEEAFKETQKALALLSSNVNIGVESMNYVHEYSNSKQLIFNK